MNKFKRNIPTKYIFIGLLILLIVSLVSCGKKRPPVEPDSLNPIMITASPRNIENVPVNTSIVITFSENMDITTIDEYSIIIEPAVPGTFSFNNPSVIFTPSEELEGGVIYTVTVANSIKDMSGNNLDRNYNWTFTTLITGFDYSGRIRVYVVEHISRTMMYNGEPYHFGFLGFAYDTTVSMNFRDTLQRTITWTWTGGGADITEDNIMAIAAVFNSETHIHYNWTFPPTDRNPFNANYVDACAAADYVNSWPNQIADNFTHTVFVEECTATQCYNCPNTAQALDDIYHHYGYPFFYAAMISDVNAEAYSRYYNELNRYGDPTCYFDGGGKVLIGGYTEVEMYRDSILAVGAREVPELELELDLNWQGNNTISLDLMFINNNTSTETGN